MLDFVNALRLMPKKSERKRKQDREKGRALKNEWMNEWMVNSKENKKYKNENVITGHHIPWLWIKINCS